MRNICNKWIINIFFQMRRVTICFIFAYLLNLYFSYSLIISNDIFSSRNDWTYSSFHWFLKFILWSCTEYCYLFKATIFLIALRSNLHLYCFCCQTRYRDRRIVYFFYVLVFFRYTSATLIYFNSYCSRLYTVIVLPPINCF